MLLDRRHGQLNFINEEDPSEICSEAAADGAWIMIRNVDFGKAGAFRPVSRAVKNPGKGCHDVYILLSSAGMRLKYWSF